MKKTNVLLFCLVFLVGSVSFGEPENARGEEDEWNTGVFTAYTASPEETDGKPKIMASGNRVYIGALACPPHLEFGTRVHVEGMGEYTCEDRMNRRYYHHGNRFDILMEDRSQALDFGVKKLPYEILDE